MVRQPASFLPGCPGGNPGSSSLGRRGMSPPAASWSCFPQVKRVRGRAVPPGQFASGSLANRTSGWQVQAIPRGRRQSGSCHTCTSWMVPGWTMCGFRRASSATLGAWRPYRGCERGHWSGTGFGVASVSWFVLLSDRQPFGQNRPRERDFPGAQFRACRRGSRAGSVASRVDQACPDLGGGHSSTESLICAPRTVA